VDGNQARLGITPPKGIPNVNLTTSLVPQGISIVDQGAIGTLDVGGYGYRIGLRTKLGRLQASTTIMANVVTRPKDAAGNAQRGVLRLSWNAITIQNLAQQAGIEDLNGDTTISAIVIYGRTAGSERIIAEIPPDSTEFIDNGSFNPHGPVASSYDVDVPLRYYYTFEREIAGHVDESGPSILSPSLEATSARMITFPDTDGADLNTTTWKSNLGIKYRNLYRIGDVSYPSLVAKIPLTRKDGANTVAVNSYLDCSPSAALGNGPDSDYDQDGMHITFQPAPVGMRHLTLHYNMLFGIVGSTLRGTPINRPDAWPDALSWNFPFPPVALASYGGALIILGPDALYRLDGASPTGMSLTRMPIEDGCIAPYSPQATPIGLVYLASRGLMRYVGGMAVEPITEAKIDPRVFIAPSTAKIAWPFWWLPTKYGVPFAAQTRDYLTQDSTSTAPAIDDTRVIEGPIEAIRSFCFGGRYYLYAVGSSYGASTCYCIDLGEQDIPITTLGVRPLDVHVNSSEHCYMLLPKFLPNDTAFQTFLDAQAKVDQDITTLPAATAHRMLARFGKGKNRIPWYIRTGPMSQGDPTNRKRYRVIEVHGKGTVDARVYVDGQVVARSKATPAETPAGKRKINLPKGTRGYEIDLEMAGDADLFGLELQWDGMPGD
jgi:hypothetical protein